jgi:hypothetical protein
LDIYGCAPVLGKHVAVGKYINDRGIRLAA